MKNLSMPKSRGRWILLAGVAAAACAVLMGAALIAFRQWSAREPRFRDGFDRDSYAQADEGGWQAFGGTWQVLDQTMQNISDDRGAKLINGNPDWRDYTVEADVQLLSETGDAGFVLRTGSEEVGVDAYHGYFAGLRDLDDTLIIGRADFGWHEFRTVSVHSRVHTRIWYHLKVVALECVIAATATTPEGEQTTASVRDRSCIRKGRFGLQSYATGALWRNLEVHPASSAELRAMIGSEEPVESFSEPRDAENLPSNPPITNLESYQQNFAPMHRELRDHHADLNATPISDLRLLPSNISPQVTVHGVVTLVSPILYIQDSSGAIAIPGAHPVTPVQIGDAVEASGDAELHSFSSVLRNARVRPLWSHTPVPPVAVTASQAATGAFDAEYAETEGKLTAIQQAGPSSLILHFDEGNQSFVAIAGNSGTAAAVRTLREGSRVRLRGIVVADKAFTGDEVPFAVLMRSAGDLQMIAPPPWWSTAHIVELALLLLMLSLCSHFLYASVERARLRAVMEERERVAMEMHDTLAQSFAGLGFQMEALCEEAQPDSRMQSQLRSTLELVRFGHMQARRNIAALRPGNLEQLGLCAALEQAANTIVRGASIQLVFSVRGERRPIPLKVSDPLFRIAQEAIANAVRHARAHSILVRVIFTRSSVHLAIRDDGQGFSMNTESSGFGIRAMEQRAGKIPASFRIRSSPGKGTVIVVRARLFRNSAFNIWPRLRDWRWGGFPDASST